MHMLVTLKHISQQMMFALEPLVYVTLEHHMHQVAQHVNNNNKLVK